MSDQPNIFDVVNPKGAQPPVAIPTPVTNGTTDHVGGTPVVLGGGATATDLHAATIPPASGGDIFAEVNPDNKAEQDPNVQAAIPETPTRNPAAQHGLLHRAWDWVNTPVFDSILPKDIKTADIIKAAAFEKMYGEAYIPGSNDFDTKAAIHLGDSPTKAGVRAFINGVAKDTASTVAGFTSPLSAATIAAGGAGRLPGAVGQAARIISPLAGTAFGLQGVHDVANAGTENTPEAWQQRLQGSAMALGGAASLGEGLSVARQSISDARTAARNNINDRVTPVTKTVAGQDIPVRADTRAGRFAAKVVNPDVLKQAAEKTASAVQQGVGNVAKEAVDSEVPTSVKSEDRFGLRGHAEDLIENQARPVFKALDELSDGEFSKAQRAEKTARRIGDFEKVNEAVEKQDALTEQHRDELTNRGLDPDEAWDSYRKGVAVQKIANQFDTATGVKTDGPGYQVNGNKLAATIDRIRRSSPEKNLFAKAGFSDSHVDALAELADTLRNEQNIPQFGSASRFLAKSLAAAIGFGHSGVLGLAEALTGESAAESLVRKGATNLLGKAMMSEPATRELTEAMKSGDASEATTAVQNMAKEDPSWWDGLKSDLTRLWQEEHGSAGLPGTVGSETPNRLSEENAPAFYSKATQVAQQKVNSGSGDSILAALRNNGVKESEIQWLGLDDYLKGKPKVSKADVEKYIDEHKIALNEVNLGGDRKGLTDLGRQRDKVFAENNSLWANHLRYADGSTDLFNAMNEGQDVEPIILKMPAEVQEPARRFVETDGMIHYFDKQLADANRAAGKPAKFEQYTLPGEKSAYTEKLLTLPEPENMSSLRSQLADAENERTQYLQTSRPVPGDVELRFQDAQKAMRQAENKLASFRSSHFDEPNVLAHVRYDDRPSEDGKKTLFLEELQSDWHQKGKRQGYQQNPMVGEIVQSPNGDWRIEWPNGTFSGGYGTQESAARAMPERATANARSGVPDAPFKNDWHELAMKRMLRHAAENGYDRLAWTTGEQQAERYDLSKQIESVLYRPRDKSLSIVPRGGDRYETLAHDVTPERLGDYIGKDAAEKLLRAKPNPNGDLFVNGLDLKIGGDWAKALYDRAIPNFLNKYAKKWGAKVGETTLKATDRSDKAGIPYTPPQKVHSIDITPAMKKSVLQEGQPIAENTPSEFDWRPAITGKAA